MLQKSQFYSVQHNTCCFWHAGSMQTRNECATRSHQTNVFTFHRLRRGPFRADAAHFEENHELIGPHKLASHRYHAMALWRTRVTSVLLIQPPTDYRRSYSLAPKHFTSRPLTMPAATGWKHKEKHYPFKGRGILPMMANPRPDT